MIYFIGSILALALVPESLLACSKHDISLAGAASTPVADILINLIVIMIISTPLGLVAGTTARRFSPAFKKLTLVLAIAGLFHVNAPGASACHGQETIEPVLQQIYAKQLNHHRQYGAYAASFDELKFTTRSDQYSFFLPSQSLPARKVSPREGVDLASLPNGVAAAASSRAFTVVAIGFAAPNRIDVWTMDQKRNFREWSVPAFPAVEPAPSAEQAVSLTDYIHDFQGTLMIAALILGLALGLSLSFAPSYRLSASGAGSRGASPRSPFQSMF